MIKYIKQIRMMALGNLVDFLKLFLSVYANTYNEGKECYE